MTQVWLVADLAYGDSGKGGIVDFLCRHVGAKTVVRFSGGPNCSHTVVLPDGNFHKFAQFGAGTLAGASTYLSRFMMVEPYALFNEHDALMAHPAMTGDPFENLYVEAGCPIITPMHWIAGQERERSRGVHKHGSCGMGLGELRWDIEAERPYLTAGQLRGLSTSTVQEILQDIRMRKSLDVKGFGGDHERLEREDLYTIARFYQEFTERVQIVEHDHLRDMPGPFVYEGSQGMLLDEKHGWAPYNTWTDCTFRNAEKLLDGMDCEIIKIGVLRALWTRHGAGPFPSECSQMIAERIAAQCPDHNQEGPWQGPLRRGYFDLPAARYAIDRIGGVDGIALTCIDHAERVFRGNLLPYAADYYMPAGETFDWTTDKLMRARPVIDGVKDSRELVKMLNVPMAIESWGPTFEQKSFQQLKRATA